MSQYIEVRISRAEESKDMSAQPTVSIQQAFFPIDELADTLGEKRALEILGELIDKMVEKIKSGESFAQLIKMRKGNTDLK